MQILWFKKPLRSSAGIHRDNGDLHTREFERKHLMPLKCWLPDSKPLVSILESGEVQGAIKRYNDQDQQALDEQNFYFSRNKKRTIPTIIALVIGLFSLFVPPQIIGAGISTFLAFFTTAASDWSVPIEMMWRHYLPWVVLFFVGHEPRFELAV